MRILSLPVISLAMIWLTSCESDRAPPVPAGSPSSPAERSPSPSPSAAQRTTHVTSKDGTRIAFETAGKGPALIIVSGALSSRALQTDRSLVAELGKRFTVYTYDRRGRGESADTKPYAVAREVEDIEALIAHAGSSAYLFGVSSGAALSMHAAATLGPTKVTKLALYEPPYGQEPAAHAKQKQRVAELAKTGQPGQAAEFFLTAIGTPPDALDGMKRSPQWPQIAKLDFTLAYDFEILGDGQVPEATARAIAVPTLVMTGEKTMPFMHPTADRIAALVPGAQRKTLAGQSHQVNGDVVAPVLTAFFTPTPS